MAYYSIRINEIASGGLDINAEASHDKWFKSMINDAILREVLSMDARLTANITKDDKTIQIVGGVYLMIELPCDRCLVPTQFEQQIPFHFLMEPKPKKMPSKAKKGEDDDDEEFSEALDFSFYDADEIDIGDLVRQHIIMAQPMHYICMDDCKGLCPTCAKNLNKEQCKCKQPEKHSPFEILKKIK